MNFENLPESWRIVRLGRVAEIHQGKTPRKLDYLDSGKFKILKVRDIKENGIINWEMKEKGFISSSIAQSYKNYVVKGGDILFTASAHSPEHIGKKIAIVRKVPSWFDGVFHVAELIKVRPLATQLDPYFLYYLLSSEEGYKMIQDQVQGVHVYPKDLANLLIPFPPLPEQKRIAEILSLAEELIRKQKESIALIDKILMAKFLEMFGDPTTNPKEWEMRRLGNAVVVIMGQSPPSSSYNVEGRGIPFLQGKAEFGDYYPTPIKWCDYPLKKAISGDILISVRAPVGDVNICPFDICIGRGLAALRPQNGVSNTWFLFFLLKKLKPKIKSLSGGSTFQAITKPDIENFQIPLPPIELQQQFAQIVEEFEKKRKEMQRILESLESFFKLLQKKAFTGELTAEWREQNKVVWEIPQITERQAILLASIYYLQNIIQKPAMVTVAMKFAFLLQHEAGLNLGYQFIPYKYGPFSKEVYEDIYELEKNLLVERIKPQKDVEITEIKLIDEFKDWAERIVDSLPVDIKETVKTYTQKYGSMELNELLDYVYGKYPEYTTKSKRKKRR